MNNNKYCVWCGTAYAGKQQVCAKCGKHPAPKENLFIDYLVSHTKEKFKSDTEETVYNALKNWALSHLYGIVLGITIISTAVTVSASDIESHIHKVNSHPNSTITEQQPGTSVEAESTEQYVFTAEDKAEISNVIDVMYANAIENCGGEITGDIRSLWVPENISANQLHHILKDRWVEDLYAQKGIIYGTVKFDGTVYGGVSTTTAKALQDKGYPVAFIGVDMDLTTADQIYYPNYYVTMVKIDGKWLILEELNTHSRWAEIKDIWIEN